MRQERSRDRQEGASQGASGRRKAAAGVVRLAAALVGGLALVWFSLPIPLGICNIGNLTGLVLSVFLLGYAVFQRRLHMAARRLWHRTAGRAALCFLAALAGGIAVTTVVLSCRMASAVANTPRTEGTVVVLGCRVYGERPSLMLQNRLEAAYRYLKEHPEAACVLSGGQGEGEDISEAECMFRYLTGKGIEAGRLYLEDRSTSTRENLRYSKEVIEEYGLAGELILVTNEFHEYRAGLVAGSLGLPYAAVAAHTAWWLFPTYYVRELYGILSEYVVAPPRT